jgi:hypothetical protein
MKVVRLKKGQNDFALVNLTLSELRIIDRALIICNYSLVSPMLEVLKAAKLPAVQMFGDELVGKVRPKDWVKKSERETPKHRDPNLGLKYSVNPLPETDQARPYTSEYVTTRSGGYQDDDVGDPTDATVDHD